MAEFSEDNPEYINNGHYVIDSEDFMSFWTFKNNHSGASPNTTTINGNEGKQLIQQCSKVYSSKPDFGGFNEIFIFSVTELRKFYSV